MTIGVIAAKTLHPRETVRLAFPPDLAAEQVEHLLGTIAGLPKRSRVVTSVEADGGQLTFRLTAALPDLSALRAALQGIAPGLRLEDATPDVARLPRLTARLGWRGSYLLLRRDQPELSVAALLSIMRATAGDERLRLTLRLRPLVRPKAPPLPTGRTKQPDWLTRALLPTPMLPRDQLRLIRQQYAGPLLGVRLEVEVWANSRARAQQLTNQLAAVIRARSGPRGRFSMRTHRFAWPSVGIMLAPPELVPLVGWPLAGPAVPGLRFNRAPQLLPDDDIPSRGPGRAFGLATWPGLANRLLVQPIRGTLSHTLLLGPTGSGKSALLTRLFVQDALAGNGALLVDLKGDTADDVLERIPEKRRGDVIVLDPGDSRPLPGLKSMHSERPDRPDLVADLWVGVFRNLFKDSWGLLSERYIRLGVQTLAGSPNASILDLPRVFHDAPFRQRLVGQANDPYLAGSWASFEQMSSGQQAEQLAAPVGKVQDLIGRQVVRNVLGQANPKLRLSEAMQQGKIVVVRLAPDEIGAPTAQLLGALVLYEAYQAVMSRQRVPQARRRPFGIYVDEPAVLSALPVPLDSLFDLARGLGVGLTLAIQRLSQLPEAVRKAALTNAGTIASFRAAADDATLAARELPGVTAEQLQHLNRYEIVLRLCLDHGLIAPVTTAKTLPPLSPTSDPEQLKAASAKRYSGRPAEPQASRNHPPDDASTTTPLGRRRSIQ
jgi:hypothetical protein